MRYATLGAVVIAVALLVRLLPGVSDDGPFVWLGVLSTIVLVTAVIGAVVAIFMAIPVWLSRWGRN